MATACATSATFDSDGDGLPDWVEGQTTAGYFFPDSLDADGNGIDASFDRYENTLDYGVAAVDSDGDGQAGLPRPQLG